MRFKKGQCLLYVGAGYWSGNLIPIGGPGPKRNEPVTCDGYNPRGYMFLVEYQQASDGERDAYTDDNFVPIISTEELEKALEPEEQTA